MKALLVGGSGFIGRSLSVALDAEKVSYYSRNRSEFLDSKGIEHIQGNVSESDKLRDAVKDFDTIFYLPPFVPSGGDKEDLFLDGVKTVVDVVRKQDTGQKLIFFSAINTDYGASEFFRLRRIAEDNVYLAKDSLTIKLSNVFGEGDRITGEIKKVSDTRIKKFPVGKTLAPVSIDDVISAVKGFITYKGTIYINSKEDLSLPRAVNVVRELEGGSPVSLVETKRKIMKWRSRIAEESGIPAWRIADLLLNFSRENTSLYRVVKEPVGYEPYLREKLKPKA